MAHHFEPIVNSDGYSCKVLLTEGDEGFTLDVRGRSAAAQAPSFESAEGSIYPMAQKRYVRKKKKKRLLGCFLWLVLLGLAAGLVVFLILRLTRNPAEAAPDPLWDGSWYADELGRIDDEEALVEGMEAFERKTGVRPYLTLLDGVAPDALNDFVEEQYEALFGSADHLLVVYDEWGDDTYFLLGRTGRGSAMTEADVAAVLSCLEAAYADPAYRSYAEAFGAGFAQGAEETSVRGNFGGVGLLLALGILLAVLSVVLILFLRKRARDAARRDWEDS